MKRQVLVAAILVTAVTSFAQTPAGADNAAFLLRCQRLTSRMAAYDSLRVVSKDSISAWKSERGNIKAEYKKVYSKCLSDDESRTYYSFVSSYNKRMASFKIGDVGDAINEAGTEVSGAVKRTGKKVQGWFEGLKK